MIESFYGWTLCCRHTSHVLGYYIHLSVFYLFIGTNMSGSPAGVVGSVSMSCWMACIIIYSSIVGNKIDTQVNDPEMTNFTKEIFQCSELYSEHESLTVKVEAGFIGVGQTAEIHSPILSNEIVVTESKEEVLRFLTLTLVLDLRINRNKD